MRPAHLQGGIGRQQVRDGVDQQVQAFAGDDEGARDDAQRTACGLAVEKARIVHAEPREVEFRGQVRIVLLQVMLAVFRDAVDLVDLGDDLAPQPGIAGRLDFLVQVAAVGTADDPGALAGGSGEARRPEDLGDQPVEIDDIVAGLAHALLLFQEALEHVGPVERADQLLEVRQLARPLQDQHEVGQPAVLEQAHRECGEHPRHPQRTPAAIRVGQVDRLPGRTRRGVARIKAGHDLDMAEVLRDVFELGCNKGLAIPIRIQRSHHQHLRCRHPWSPPAGAAASPAPSCAIRLAMMRRYMNTV